MALSTGRCSPHQSRGTRIINVRAKRGIGAQSTPAARSVSVVCRRGGQLSTTAAAPVRPEGPADEHSGKEPRRREQAKEKSKDSLNRDPFDLDSREIIEHTSGKGDDGSRDNGASMSNGAVVEKLDEIKVENETSKYDGQAFMKTITLLQDQIAAKTEVNDRVREENKVLKKASITKRDLQRICLVSKLRSTSTNCLLEKTCRVSIYQHSIICKITCHIFVSFLGPSQQ